MSKTAQDAPPDAARPYEIIIGLEVHVQLATQTKLFSRSSTKFGAPPNTQTSPICIGMPGTLPVMNRQAFKLALRTAVALNCNIPSFTKWDRKQYYYPDLPKGYQISQYDLPMSENGHLWIRDVKQRFQPRRVGIIRAHLEEDAGKSMHDEAAGKADSRIDLNRTGTPLLEIVTEPDIRSPLEAKTFLEELKLLLNYLEVSDCNMQEGSLRVDANINLHMDTPEGKVATPIVEVKNVNSFRAVERAMVFEAERQYAVWQETGQRIGDVPKQTRGWHDDDQVTRAQRHKEDSSDYRYFPDPDLMPVVVSPEEVEQVRSQLGELPAQQRDRLVKDYQLQEEDAYVIVGHGGGLGDYFTSLADACGDARSASNWIQQDVLRTLKEREWTVGEFPIPSARLGELLKAVKAGDVDSTRARDVFKHMLDEQSTATAAMQALGIEKVDDSDLIALCQQLIDNNPKIVADIQAGKTKAAGALIGQARKLNPNADPNRVREMCIELAKKQ